MGWFGGKKDDSTTPATNVATLPTIPGYQAGTWTIDATHSEVSFVVRHMAVSKVRGRFGAVSGTIITADDVTASSVTADIDVTTVTTFNEQRDGHLQSSDFFETEKFPSASFTTTGLAFDGEDFVLDGELTLKGVTKAVSLKLEVSGFGPDAYGGTRAGFAGTGRINRRDFGLEFDARIDNGGLVVADNVDLQLDIEAVLNA